MLAYVDLRYLHRVSITALPLSPQFFLLLLWSYLSTLAHLNLEPFDGIIIAFGRVESAKATGFRHSAALEALAGASEGLCCVWVAVAPVPQF